MEHAVGVLRDAAVGRTIGRVRLLHPALRRRLSPARARTLRGARIESVQRRGKHQLIWLDDHRVLHVHFRMTGDWLVDRTSDPLPAHARAAIELTDGTRIVLDDPRALATLDIHPALASPDLGLGPEPSDSSFTADWLRTRFARVRGAVKPALLDQRTVAGLGNIYAAEALWRARIDPRAPAASLRPAELRRLVLAVRAALERAASTRYGVSKSPRFHVYDREGKLCRRCRTPIVRIRQSGRSSYFCPRCQRAPARSRRFNRVPRSAPL